MNDQAYEEDDDLDYEDFLGEDDWEDSEAIQKVQEKYPNWYVVKVVNFTQGGLASMKQWCIDNCKSPYEHVGWHSGCSYTVGVVFESTTDAVMFKLTWGS